MSVVEHSGPSSYPRVRVLISSTAPAVAAVTLLALVVRFAFLDAKGFWQDEGYTVLLLDHSFGRSMSIVAHSENTPPLYFALAWLWSRAFGLGEAGLRSLSALAGTAVVPVLYLAARELVSRRGALLAAALAAVSPGLVWFSQDARAYSLLTLTIAFSLLFFARALTGRSRALALWSVAGALTVATHYFGAFAIAAEALALLLYRRDELRRVLLALIPPVLALAALAPLVVEQSRHPADWISTTGLPGRVAELPVAWTIGFQVPFLIPALLGGSALAAYGLWLLIRRAAPSERRGGLIALATAVVTTAIPIAFAVAGIDFVYFRALIGCALLLLVALSAGFAATRSGGLAAAALFVLSLAIVLASASQPKFDREDWRGAVRSLPPAGGARILVVTPPTGRAPVEWYAHARSLSTGGATIAEVDVIGVARNRLGALTGSTTPRPGRVAAPGPGFRLVARRTGARYTTLRFVARRPLPLSRAELVGAHIDSVAPALLIARAGGPR